MGLGRNVRRGTRSGPPSPDAISGCAFRYVVSSTYLSDMRDWKRQAKVMLRWLRHLVRDRIANCARATSCRRGEQNAVDESDASVSSATC